MTFTTKLFNTIRAVAFLACALSASFCAHAQTVPFQQRNYVVSLVPLATNVTAPAGADLIFVILPNQQKFLAIPTDGNVRACYDPTNQRFYRVDGAAGVINAFTALDMTLINPDGTFFLSKTETPALNGNTISQLESYSIPLNIDASLPADIALFSSFDPPGDFQGGFVAGDTLAYRTGETNVYEITRDVNSFVQRTDAIPEIKTAGLVSVEVDTENDTILLVQHGATDANNVALTDRLSSYTHGGQFFDQIDLTTITGYTGNGSAVTYDIDNGDIYVLDGGQMIVFKILRPSLTSVTPNHGPVNGSNTVQINGANMPPDAIIFFGGVQALNQVNKSSTLITCNPPPGTDIASLNNGIGVVDVTMTGTGIIVGSPITLPSAYTYGNLPPVAFLVASPFQGPTPLDVSFNTAGSMDPDGTLVSRIIDFGDGTSYTFPSDLSVTTVSHSYAANATFTAVLTVTDNMGATATDTAIIIVGKGGEDLVEALVLQKLAMRILNIAPPNPPDPAHPAQLHDSITLTGQVVLPDGFTPPGLTLSISVNNDTVTSDNLVLNSKGSTGSAQEKFTMKVVKTRGTPPNTYAFSYTRRLVNLYAAKPTIPPGETSTRVSIPIVVQLITNLGRSFSFVKTGVNQAVIEVKQAGKGDALSLVRK